MVEEPLIYEAVPYIKAAVDFKGSPELERARKSLLVFLVIVLFLEAAGVTITSATLGGWVNVTILRPLVVNVGFWVLFIYVLATYYSLFRKEIGLFTLKHISLQGFMTSLSAFEFQRRLRSTLGLEGAQLGSGTTISQDDSKTVTRWKIYGVPQGIPMNVAGYNQREDTFTYKHEPELVKFYQERIPVIRLAFAHNYLVYVLPLHVSALMILAKMGIVVDWYGVEIRAFFQNSRAWLLWS
jgi:hypothetical protein